MSFILISFIKAGSFEMVTISMIYTGVPIYCKCNSMSTILQGRMMKHGICWQVVIYLVSFIDLSSKLNMFVIFYRYSISIYTSNLVLKNFSYMHDFGKFDILQSNSNIGWNRI